MMAELKALSKLKMAGKLHYWRGTIEIDEYELHTICDEIQAEYDKTVSAINKAAGNWAKADALLRERAGDTLTAEQVRDAVKRGANFDYGEFGEYVSRENWQAIADELNARAERKCSIEEKHGDWYCTECGDMVGTCDTASELFIYCNAIELWNYCPNCGARVIGTEAGE